MEQPRDPRGRKPNPANTTDPHEFARLRCSTKKQITGILGMIKKERGQQVTVDDVVKAALTVASTTEIINSISARN